MSTGNDVVIVGAVRTAVGGFLGSLKDVTPTDLAAVVIGEALRRASTAPEDVGHVVMGQVIPSHPHDAYLARVAAIRAGIPATVPAMTLNRLCGSGLQAIISAAQSIRLGECAIAVAGGAESMSNAPHVLTSSRTGTKMGEATLIDSMLTILTDPFGHGHMGVTAENVATRCGITRAQQDAFAAESHRRAAHAIAQGRFKSQIVPVELKNKKGTVLFDTDEHVRADATADQLATLRPAFQRDGTVTAGNASGINDGAAAVVLMSATEAARRGLPVLARIVSWGHAGVAPKVMGLGPVGATETALTRAGLAVTDMDVIESNEAFAAQACAVSRQLGLPPEKTNPNGGAIALGHPLGASGAIITVKALYELARSGGRRGLATMCIGGGQGIALIIERLDV
ncbi:beta-ketothiolase BktB [Nitrospirillum sp. BR 11164]|uniref:beta-ketothiolase BktB n=1 Tax=Nitrospirillum sp. BR 11164 TaxID=3104324 RepID=UPI002B00003B|nr:beta-ketothiolase BktB [Nitrospirillum sp. BR 11164]MEA1652908.1 beta-ketothiolase BktB [Nitrospirillum sp. BR 11164]